MLIVAFALSVLFIVVGGIGVLSTNNFAQITWYVLWVFPGAAGLAIALLTYGIKWVPVLKVLIPILPWVSCAVTACMVVYTGLWYLKKGILG